jgi:uncharacterized protein (DUF2141 family)
MRATFTVVLSIGCAAVHAADLEVEVRDVALRVGEIRVAVFDNARDFSADVQVRAMITTGGEITAGVFTREEDFPHPPLQAVVVAPSARTVRVQFKDLQPGEYAVGAFQDRNLDGKLDATVGGRTLEPWGISNDARPRDRPPTWEESKFSLPAEGTTVVLTLRP